jgi:hypothetical protein
LYIFCLTQLLFPSDEGVAKEDAAPVPPPSTSATVENNPQKEAASETPMVTVLEKAAVDAKSKRRKKDTKPASASLEAHQDVFSSSDVSILLAQVLEYAAVSLLSFPFPSASDAEVSIPWH